MPKSRVVVRLLRTLAVVMVVFSGPFAAAVSAQENGETDGGSGSEVDPAVANAGFVEILEVSGLLDEVMAAAIEEAVRGANSDGARALVLQINSKQAVVDDERLNELGLLIDESPVPVHAWVGPSGSRASGKVAQLVGLAESVGVAIGAKLGPTGPQVLDIARFGEVWAPNQELLENTALNWEQAIDVGVVACDFAEEDELGNPLTPDESLARCANPTIGDFLVSLDEFDSRVVETAEGPRLEPLTSVRFRGLSLLDQLMHTVASPPVAYLMVVIGLMLIVFEFYSIGIGIAGALGAVFLALGGYGLAALPFRGWALALIVLSMLAFAIDIQTGVPRAWTVIGMVAFAVGTVFLFSESDVSMSWVPMLVSLLGMGAVVFRGMPIMVRGRFSTTVIPRDFLIGEAGTVASTEGDTGVVEVRDVSWPAASGSVLHVGQAVEVTEVEADGVVLRVD